MTEKEGKMLINLAIKFNIKRHDTSKREKMKTMVIRRMT